ncbi:HK97-gp10 family putative phage morphogenesis protein [Herbaspirillum sp. NPDC101397]|uniref:HK97-gp10 family putative phage morphogenesis protein n=1 Tax=Herbaspirillum sp. NPDC101397 TaxID=3364006 RepID=UPI00383B4188
MAKSSVTGQDEAIAKLLSLADKLTDPIRSAANTGATVMKEEVIARAPRDKGILQENIYQKHVDELSSDDRHVYYISWRKGRKTSDGAYYGVWVEYGHWYVPPKVKGTTWKAHRANAKAIFVAAHPFIRPAYEAKKEEVLRVMQEKLAENTSKAIKELSR